MCLARICVYLYKFLTRHKKTHLEGNNNKLRLELWKTETVSQSQMFLAFFLFLFLSSDEASKKFHNILCKFTYLPFLKGFFSSVFFESRNEKNKTLKRRSSIRFCQLCPFQKKIFFYVCYHHCEPARKIIIMYRLEINLCSEFICREANVFILNL